MCKIPFCHALTAACLFASPAMADMSFVNPANNHTYVLATQWMTWQDGRTWAQAQGGYMVSITSAEEQTWFFDTIYRPFGEAVGISMWIGLTDEIQEGEWRWESGENFSYSNWAPGEPNNAVNEDYVAMWYVNPSGSWNDYSSPIFNGGPLHQPVVAEIIPTPSALVALFGGSVVFNLRRRGRARSN
jgi:hypothetical protein